MCLVSARQISQSDSAIGARTAIQLSQVLPSSFSGRMLPLPRECSSPAGKRDGLPTLSRLGRAGCWGLLGICRERASRHTTRSVYVARHSVSPLLPNKP